MKSFFKELLVAVTWAPLHSPDPPFAFELPVRGWGWCVSIHVNKLLAPRAFAQSK